MKIFFVYYFFSEQVACALWVITPCTALKSDDPRDPGGQCARAHPQQLFLAVAF